MEFKDSFFLMAIFFDGVLALPLDNILGIFKLGSITPLPNNKNKFVLGITNAKGHIVPVLDLKIDQGILKNDFLVIMETSNGKKGVLFKKLEGIIQILKEEMEKGELFEGTIPFIIVEKDDKKIIIPDLGKNHEIYELVDIYKDQFSKAA